MNIIVSKNKKLKLIDICILIKVYKEKEKKYDDSEILVSCLSRIQLKIIHYYFQFPFEKFNDLID